MAKDQSPALTSHDLNQAIRSRYEAPEWLVEQEVTLDGRRLDAVAFGMWKDYRVVGFEIKVSRGDWLRELASFQKSEGWMEVVDAFYVVTPPKLVKVEELPVGWGLLELTGSRMMTRAHSNLKSPGRTLPREVCARFLSRMLKREADSDRTAMWKAREELRAEVQESIRRDAERKTQHERDELKLLRNQVDELADIMGIKPREWDKHRSMIRAAATVSDALKNGGLHHLRRQLDQAREVFKVQHERIEQTLAALPESDVVNV